MGVVPHDAAIAVDEGVDPTQALVRGSQRNQRRFAAARHRTRQPSGPTAPGTLFVAGAP